MVRRQLTWVWVPALLTALLLAVWLLAPHWTLATISRVRFAEPVSVADSFLMAAARVDTLRLRELATDTIAVSHLLALFHAEPELVRAAVQGRRLDAAGHVAGQPRIAVSYRIPSRVQDSICYLAGDSDHLQVTLARAAETWKVLYAGLGPC
jgi:hypothetical protein